MELQLRIYKSRITINKVKMVLNPTASTGHLTLKFKKMYQTINIYFLECVTVITDSVIK